jgi:DNA-binding CsgD family transcriptional regulator
VNPPLVVVEGPRESLDHAVREAQAAGWTVVDGFAAGRSGATASALVVRAGPVATAEDASAALLAALDGAGLIVDARAPREVIDRLVDDLRRLGRVDHRVGAPARTVVLAPEARAILGLLAEGHSLGEAAHVLGIPRRTADRRLAEARRALGVERTTEAIARAQRLGWLMRGDG